MKKIKYLITLLLVLDTRGPTKLHHNLYCCEFQYKIISEGLSKFENQDALAFHHYGAECTGSGDCRMWLTEETQYVIDKDDGSYWIGSIDNDGKVVFNNPVKVFALPVEVGTSWNSSSSGTYYKNDGSSYQIKIEFDLAIISNTEKITTSLEEFEDCLWVKGTEYWWGIGDVIYEGSEFDIDIWYAHSISTVKEIFYSKTYGYFLYYDLIEFSGNLNNSRYDFIRPPFSPHIQFYNPK